MRRGIFALCILLIFYVVFGMFITIFQERLIYLPPAQDFFLCETIPKENMVSFRGTRMYSHIEERPVVVIYHGNADSACNMTFLIPLLERVGYGYVFVEYTGYGGDNKRPSHELVKSDVENVIRYLGEHNASKTAVLGFSIGTGAASYHASIASPKKTVLISPFTDLLAVARNRLWFYPINWMGINAFDNVSLLDGYTGQILIVHGNQDAIIPYRLGTELYSSIQTDKEFITIEGSGHNDIFYSEKTSRALQSFLSE